MTREELIAVAADAILGARYPNSDLPTEIPRAIHQWARQDAEAALKAVEENGACLHTWAHPAQPFKRHSDPHGCTYRSGGDCASIGTRLHCKLEAGHQPLGHDFVVGPNPPFEPDQCACYTGTGQDEAGGHVAYVCGEPRAAHGQPHAMEVSGPYVLKVEGRA